jgi:hypothetical protein
MGDYSVTYYTMNLHYGTGLSIDEKDETYESIAAV